MRSVAARTAACRCAIVGFRASASATSDCRIESCARAGDVPAIASARTVNTSCRNCIPLLAEHFFRLNAPEPAPEFRGAFRTHYSWARLGLGRRRERRLRIGGDERREAEGYVMRFFRKNGNCFAQRDSGGRRGGAKR